MAPMQGSELLEPFAALCGADLGLKFNVRSYMDPQQVLCPTCYAKAPYVAPTAPKNHPSTAAKPKLQDVGRQANLF